MDFSVIVKENEVVRASLPLEQQWLPLSNLDLLLPPQEFNVFLCYTKPPQCNGPWMTRTLKRSLAQTLVLFYPLSGEVVQSSAGEPVLLCNNRGVDFFEAFADVELREMDFYNTDAAIEEKLFPKKKKDAVLSILVTELRCGSFIVSCTFDHRITDAYSANMFLVAWAETAQSKSMSIIPSFQRSLLTPRRPGSYDASLDNMYVLISKLPPPTTTTTANDIVSRIFYITAEKIDSLQAEASSKGCRRTKLESLSAFLWQKIAQTHTRKGGATEKCKIGIVVNGRTRLCSNGSMSNYFGNVLSIPMGEESAEELSTKPLSWVASAVHGFLSAATCMEHFLGLIDWVEAHRPEPAMTRIYSREKEDRGPAFVVSSGFPVSQVDFGWGRPVFGAYHFPWGSECGYVMPMPSASRDGDWVMYIHLLRKQLELLEKEAGAVLRPITPEYYLGDDL